MKYLSANFHIDTTAQCCQTTVNKQTKKDKSHRTQVPYIARKNMHLPQSRTDEEPNTRAAYFMTSG